MKRGKTLLKILFIFLIGVLFCAGVSVVKAQTQNDLLGLQYATQTGLGTTDIRVTVARIFQVAFGLLGVIALGLVIYAGFLWMTAGGDEKKIDTAKKIIRNAIIGLAIILSAFAIVSYIISSLVNATTGQGGQVGGAGTGGGGGIPGTGSMAFKVSNIAPAGQVPIRNVLVRVVFNYEVDQGTLANNILITKKNDGSVVQGSFSVFGSVVEFTPDALCANTPCFDEDTEYDVKVVNGPTGIKNTFGQTLSCVFGSVCQAGFTTGKIVDTTAPQIDILSPLSNGNVCVNSNFNLKALATDDYGISFVQFYVNNATTPQYLDTPTGTVTKFEANAFWDTTNLNFTDQYKIKAVAKDLDSNVGNSREVEVTLRKEHCCNNTKDEDEQDIDCGGQDCSACIGGSCTQNSNCQSGLCQQGICVNYPIIVSFSPLKGASNTFLSINGQGFGQTPGHVYLKYKDASGVERKTEAFMPAACGSSSWSDYLIVVEIPDQTFPDSYDLEVITTLVCENNQFCSDDTLNDRGTKEKFVVDEKEVHPSICALTPSQGKYKDVFDILGKGLGASSSNAEVYLGGFSVAGFNWSDSVVSDVAVPNLTSGNIPVYVKNNNQISNNLLFFVAPIKVKPFISDVSPSNGAPSQYITISGENFGTSPKIVYFYHNDLNQGKAAADVKFPDICSGFNWWRDNQIIVKVPNIDIKTYKLGVETDFGQSNLLDFNVNSNPVTPGICALEPSSGKTQTLVTVKGENFGNVSGKVRFLTSEVLPKQWVSNSVAAEVPALSQTGFVPIKLISSTGVESNAVDFYIGSCLTKKDICATNQICCSDGTCAAVCQETMKTPEFKWKFSTGILPLVPSVLENPSCANNQLQSPSPWKESEDACLNSSLAVQFTLPMDKTSFKINDDILLYKCVSRQDCKLAADKSNLVTLNNIKSTDKSFVAEHNLLEKNTWYKVELHTGNQGIVSADSVPLNNDYSWYFKTKDTVLPCEVDSIIVLPPAVTIEEYLGEEILQALGYNSLNCNILNSSAFNWSWSVDNTVSINLKQPLNLDPLTKNMSGEQTVVALKDTVAPAKAIASIYNQQKQQVTNYSEVTVKFLGPKISAYWPNCREACRNAEVGARFNINIAQGNNLTNNVYLYQCANESCVYEVGAPLCSGNTVGFCQVGLASPSFDINSYKLQFNAPVLNKDTYYLALIKNGLVSSSGKALEGLNYDLNNDKILDSFAWIFKVRDTDDFCDIFDIRLLPAKATVRDLGAKQFYSTEVYAAPDACSSAGQKLNNYAYDWQWSLVSTDSSRAQFVYPNLKYNAQLPPTCNNLCLRTGTESYRAICGNNFKEYGEDCDDGNTKSGDGCSSLCLNEGNANTCGNGKMDTGEDCDDGNQLNGDGCSVVCLHEGSIDGGRNYICGNSIVEVGEDCDDGNNSPGDGCSSSCLHEGTKGPVCGNKTIEKGEDCDDGNLNNGDGCNDNCLNEGSSLAVCGNNVLNLGEDCDDGNASNGDGCSRSCLHEGTNNVKYFAPSVCGNASKGTGEDCDYGSNNSLYGCSGQCLNLGSISNVGVCGNGIVENDKGEDCDPGGICFEASSKGGPCTSNKDCVDASGKQTGICRAAPTKFCSANCLNLGAKSINDQGTCGNGSLALDPGEDCDDGGVCQAGLNNGKICTKSSDCPSGKCQSVSGDGCSAICLSEGASYVYDSLCQDGQLGKGEECETAPAVKGSPYQWVKENNFVEDSLGSGTSTVLVNAKTKSSQNKEFGDQSPLILQFGFKNDLQCLDYINKGVGFDSGCHLRPKVVKVTPPANSQNTCTNGAILVEFSEPMFSASLLNNVLIATGYNNACPVGTQAIALQTEAEQGVFGKIYQTIKNAYNWIKVEIFGFSAKAANNWCLGENNFLPILNEEGKILTLSLDKPLKKNTEYKIIILGDADLTDDQVLGIKSALGVGYAGTDTDVYKDNNIIYHAYIWSFTTGDTCQLQAVQIRRSDATDPAPYEFYDEKEQKFYKAVALDAAGREIVPIPQFYTWKLTWSSEPKDIFTLGQNINALEIEVVANNKRGNGYVQVEAVLEKPTNARTSPYYVQAKACASDNVCASKKCECPTAGCGTDAAPLGFCQVVFSDAQLLSNLVCENPWPPKGAKFNNSGFYQDDIYNFKIGYCRDGGTQKVCLGGSATGTACTIDADCPGGGCQNNIADDLPYLQEPAAKNIKGKMCTAIAGKNVLNINNACDSDSQCGGVAGACQITDLLAEYIFESYKEKAVCHNENKNTNNLVCQSNDDCRTCHNVNNVTNNLTCTKDLDCKDPNYPVCKLGDFAYCYAEQGQNLTRTGDVVGVRVMKNNNHLPPHMWYEEKVTPGQVKIPNLTVDGYSALSEGRTVYVNAVNTSDNISTGYYTNIYLMSYNQGAKPETLSLYNELLTNWYFNTNITVPQIKEAMVRDTRRLEDLNVISDKLEDYKKVYGFYPKLEAGTYLQGMTFSPWPSWQAQLGSLLGITLPIDPKTESGINRFAKCGSQYNEITCWDDKTQKFDIDGLLQKPELTLLKSPENSISYVYEYQSLGKCNGGQYNGKDCVNDAACLGGVCENKGSHYKLDYNVEYIGTGKLSGGSAYQCYDDNVKQWVNNGTCHSLKNLQKCILGSWRNSCQDGIIEAACGEECDINNVKYCENTYLKTGLPLPPAGFINEKIQVCNNSCKLEPSSNTLTTYQCSSGECRDNTGLIIANGQCHPHPGEFSKCVNGNFVSTCGNGVLECNEECDGQDVNFCSANTALLNSLGLNPEQRANVANEVVQSCQSCSLIPSTQTLLDKEKSTDPATKHACFGTCGDGILQSQYEQCEKGLPISVSCSQLGWGTGTVTCDNICKYNGVACSEGPLGLGSIRVKLSWPNGLDLDLHALIKQDFDQFHIYYNNKGTVIAPPYASLAWDDVAGNQGPGNTGLEIINYTKTGSNYYEKYVFYAQSYFGFKANCGLPYDLCPQAAVTAEIIKGGTALPTVINIPDNLTNSSNFWYLFSMDRDGNITVENKVQETAPGI